MRRAPPLLLTALFVLSVCPSGTGQELDGANATDGVLRADLAWSPGAAERRAPGRVPLRFDPPEGLALPAGIVDGRFGMVPLLAAPGGGVAIVVDVGSHPVRAWFDTDADGTLADERALFFRRIGLRHMASTSVRVRQGTDEVPVSVRLERGALEADDTFRADVAAHRSGAFVVGGRLVPVALSDGNGDLRFDDARYDAVLLDLDGDGALDGAPGSVERFLPGDVVVVGGESRRIEVAEGGAGVTLTRAAARTLLDPIAGGAQGESEGVEALLQRFAQERGLTAPARAATVARLGRTGAPGALVLLDDTARSDADATVRLMAIAAIGRGRFGGEGEAALARFLGRQDEAIVLTAIAALSRGRYSRRAEHFSSLLHGRSENVVREAARHLAAIDDASSRGRFLSAYESSRSAALRLAMYEGVRASPRAPTAREAMAAAKDRHAPLRVLGMTDLVARRDGRARKVLIEACNDPTPSTVVPLIGLLAAVRDGSATEALLRLGAPHAHRSHALRTLARVPDAAVVPRLVEALEDEDEDVRRLAARALLGRRDRRGVTALLQRVAAEPDDGVLAEVIASLSAGGDPRALAALEKRAEEHEDYALADVLALLGSPWMRGVQHALPILRRGLDDESWRVREAAVRAVAASREPVLLPLLTARLKDSRSAVRVATIEALAELRQRDAVAPLIAVLEKERAARARDALARALFQLTGVHLYDDAALWSAWFAENGATFRVPAVPPALPNALAGPTRDGSGPKFYGIPIRTDSVVFVIDRSGSMAAGGGLGLSGPATPGDESRFGTAVRELLKAVAALDDGAMVNVILFGTDVRAWRERMQPLSQRSRKALRVFLTRQSPTGGTKLYDALERGILERGVETVVVLSDGGPTHGKYLADGAILSAIKDINAKRQVEVSCVAIGTGSTLLRRLAGMHRGVYVER